MVRAHVVLISVMGVLAQNIVDKTLKKDAYNYASFFDYILNIGFNSDAKRPSVSLTNLA